MTGKKTPPLSGVDRFLVGHFVAFAITSWLFEPYLVLGWDLRAFPPLGELPGLATQVAPHTLAYTAAGSLWRWYAEHDPVFFDCPAWLLLMCAWDWFVHGTFYLWALYAWWHRLESARLWSIIVSSELLYSCIIYFAWEVMAAPHGTSMLVVFGVNLPYAIMPAVLLWRATRPGPFFPGNKTRTD
jgi:hypothetical protein